MPSREESIEPKLPEETLHSIPQLTNKDPTGNEFIGDGKDTYDAQSSAALASQHLSADTRADAYSAAASLEELNTWSGDEHTYQTRQNLTLLTDQLHDDALSANHADFLNSGMDALGPSNLNYEDDRPPNYWSNLLSGIAPDLHASTNTPMMTLHNGSLLDDPPVLRSADLMNWNIPSTHGALVTGPITASQDGGGGHTVRPALSNLVTESSSSIPQSPSLLPTYYSTPLDISTDPTSPNSHNPRSLPSCDSESPSTPIDKGASAKDTVFTGTKRKQTARGRRGVKKAEISKEKTAGEGTEENVTITAGEQTGSKRK